MVTLEAVALIEGAGGSVDRKLLGRVFVVRIPNDAFGQWEMDGRVLMLSNGRRLRVKPGRNPGDPAWSVDVLL